MDCFHILSVGKESISNTIMRPNHIGSMIRKINGMPSSNNFTKSNTRKKGVKERAEEDKWTKANQFLIKS